MGKFIQTNRIEIRSWVNFARKICANQKDLYLIQSDFIIVMQSNPEIITSLFQLRSKYGIVLEKNVPLDGFSPMCQCQSN